MNDREEGFSELTAAFVDREREPDPEVGPSDPPEDAGPEQAPESPPTEGGTRRRRWLVPAVVLLLVASNIALAVLLWRAAPTGQERAVAAVAERFTQNLVTFDHRTLDADIERIQQDATGTFRRQFDSALGGDVAVFREAIREAAAESSGTVQGAAVTEIAGDRATAVVVAEQQIRNSETPDGRTVVRVIELELLRTSDGWKVNEVSTLGADDS